MNAFSGKNAVIYADKKEKAAYLLAFKEAQELLKDPGRPEDPKMPLQR